MTDKEKLNYVYEFCKKADQLYQYLVVDQNPLKKGPDPSDEGICPSEKELQG